MDIFTQIQINDNTQAFYAIVNSKSLKIDILLVVERKTDERGKTIQRLIFSTDTKMNALEVLEYYHCRFQIEFNFRDAKQATGLNHCQARDLDKLYFHFNTSLTTINISNNPNINAEVLFAVEKIDTLIQTNNPKKLKTKGIPPPTTPIICF